jgi:transcriptional regulator with GAF, ATPase, and Fis domain
LLERSSELATEAEQIEERHLEAESLLNDLASLYVAAFQLGGALSLAGVVRHMAELLEQLVGARAFAIYVVDVEGKLARPVVARGQSSEAVSLDDGPISDVCLTGVAKIREGVLEGGHASGALALVPLKVEDEVVGVIEITQLLPHKQGFAHVDHELFKLLSRHGAAALIAANLYENEATPRHALRGVHEHLAVKSKEPSQVES